MTIFENKYVSNNFVKTKSDKDIENEFKQNLFNITNNINSLTTQKNKDPKVNIKLIADSIRIIIISPLGFNLPKELIPKYQNLVSSIINIYNINNIRDPIFSNSGLFFEKEKNKKLNRYDRNKSYINFISVDTVGDLYSNTFVDKINFPIYKQNLNIKFNLQNFSSFVKKWLSSGLSSNLLDKQTIENLYIIFYHVFFLYLNQNKNHRYYAYQKTNYLEKGSTDELIYQFNVDSQYNFYNNSYENLFNSNFKYQTIIPNYYLVESYLYTDESNKVKDLVSLNNRLQVSEQSILDNNYYENYSKTVSSILTSSLKEVENLSNIAKNYLLDSVFVNNSKTTLSTESFPYVNTINFSNQVSDPYSDFVSSNGMQMLVCNNVFNTFFDNTKFLIEKTNNDTSNNLLDTYNISYDQVFSFENIKNNVGFYIAPKKENLFIVGNEKYQQFREVSSVFSYIKLQNITLNNFKRFINYFTIANGGLINNYPLCYGIEKSINNKINQIIGVSRDDKILEYQIKDTQVTYNTETKYDIYSYDLGCAINYVYNQITYGSIGTINCVAEMRPDLRIFKNLIATKNTKIIDKPPLPVDVNIVPFVGVNNALRFLFNTQVGSLTVSPIAIEQGEDILFENLKQIQNLKNNKLSFETDDNLTEVQIFRITQKPDSYDDFSGNLYKTLKITNSTATSFIDSITPNIKYYYTFRSVDVHNKISNPTSIFEVEIVDNDGAVYPIIKEYIIKNNENYDTTKSFKKYLFISPSIFQSEIIPNEDATAVKYGDKNNLWGQKFKIRVTSKKTGKAFDLNVTFTKTEYDL